MARERITLDLAQCEVFNHLPPMKAGILIKAVVSYCTTGDVASWGADADLRPIFLTLKETIEKCREEDNVKQDKDKRSERNRRYYLRRIKTIQTIKTSYKESEGEGKKRSKRKEGEGKESNKEKINITIYEKKANEQTELFESETAHTEAKEPRFQKPSLAEVADYVKEKGYEEWVDAEAFWSYHENGDWMAGRKKMKSWHLAVTTWMRKSKEREERMQRMRQQQRTPHGTSVGERAYNMLHFEYEGHPEMWKEEQKKFDEINSAYE